MMVYHRILNIVPFAIQQKLIQYCKSTILQWGKPMEYEKKKQLRDHMLGEDQEHKKENKNIIYIYIYIYEEGN